MTSPSKKKNLKRARQGSRTDFPQEMLPCVEKRLSEVDRRTGDDRRKAYKLGYFVEGGTERRSGVERRFGMERRKNWNPKDECKN